MKHAVTPPKRLGSPPPVASRRTNGGTDDHVDDINVDNADTESLRSEETHLDAQPASQPTSPSARGSIVRRASLATRIREQHMRETHLLQTFGMEGGSSSAFEDLLQRLHQEHTREVSMLRNVVEDTTQRLEMLQLTLEQQREMKRQPVATPPVAPAAPSSPAADLVPPPPSGVAVHLAPVVPSPCPTPTGKSGKPAKTEQSSHSTSFLSVLKGKSQRLFSPSPAACAARDQEKKDKELKALTAEMVLPPDVVTSKDGQKDNVEIMSHEEDDTNKLEEKESKHGFTKFAWQEDFEDAAADIVASGEEKASPGGKVVSPSHIAPDLPVSDLPGACEEDASSPVEEVLKEPSGTESGTMDEDPSGGRGSRKDSTESGTVDEVWAKLKKLREGTGAVEQGSLAGRRQSPSALAAGKQEDLSAVNRTTSINSNGWDSEVLDVVSDKDLTPKAAAAAALGASMGSSGSGASNTADKGPEGPPPQMEHRPSQMPQFKRALPRIAGLKRQGTGCLKQTGAGEEGGEATRSTPQAGVSFLKKKTSVMFDESAEEGQHQKTDRRVSTLTVRPIWQPTVGEDIKDLTIKKRKGKSIWTEVPEDPTLLSREGDKTVPSGGLDRFASHPNNQFNFYCDMLCMLCIGYDMVMIPVAVFHAEETSWLGALHLFTTLFWTVDFLRHFSRGFYVEGEVVLSFHLIAKRYAFSWALPDCAILLSDWATQLIRFTSSLGSDQTNVGRLVRLTRSIRSLRLIRGIKTGHLLKLIEDRIQSEALAVVWTTCKLFMGILFINHWSACIWYLIGSQCEGKMPNWIEEYLSEHHSGDEFIYQYLTSFHWALTQFTPASIEVQPHNSFERLFAICLLMFALVTVSTFVSGITSAVMQLRQLHSVRSKQFWMLRRYLFEVGVPTQLAVRINNYCEHAYRIRGRKTQEKDIQLLMLLSQSLRAELRAAIFGPSMTRHAFFMLIHNVAPLTMRSLCNTAVTQLELDRNDHLFGTGEAASAMYFVRCGELTYHMNDELVGERVGHHTWLSEAALWTSWVHKGALQAKRDCFVFMLDADNFGKVVNVNADARHEAVSYAKGFLQGLNREPEWKLNDLYCSSLIEGLWFRLLNDFQVTRRTTVAGSRRSEQGRKSDLFSFAYQTILAPFVELYSKIRLLVRRRRQEGLDEDDEQESSDEEASPTHPNQQWR